MYTLKNGMVAGNDEFILSSKYAIPTELTGGGNTHVLMVGSSGSGKTTRGFIPNIMQLNSSMVIIDQKGALYRDMAPGLRSAGYNVDVIDFIHPEKSTVHWNPLVRIKTEEQEDAFARTFFVSTGKSDDAYWDLAPAQLFKAIFAGLKEMKPGQTPTLRDIMTIESMVHSRGNEGSPRDNALDIFFNTLRAETPGLSEKDKEEIAILTKRINDFDSKILKAEFDVQNCDGASDEPSGKARFELNRLKRQRDCLAKQLSDIKEREFKQVFTRKSRAYDLWMGVSHNADTTFACILSEFSIKMAPFTTSGLLALMDNGPQVDFARLGRVCDENGNRIKPTALFIVCSDTSRALDPLISVLESQMFDELVRLADDELGGQLEQPVTFFLDDFASGTPLMDAPKLVANVRSRRIRMVMCVQSLAQLTALYGSDAQSIVTNCDVRLMFGGVGSIAEAAILNRGEKLPDHLSRAVDPHKVVVFCKGKDTVVDDCFDPAWHPNHALFEMARFEEERAHERAEQSLSAIEQHDHRTSWTYGRTGR